jgi:predicted nucleic acid-binding protein
MILVDASVWIDHFRAPDPLLEDLLIREHVLCHPFVAGELALGNFRRRAEVLEGLDDLPMALPADEEEVRRFIEQHRLFGRGLGYVDTHLLVSTSITPACQLWTRDRRLRVAAEELGHHARLHH